MSTFTAFDRLTLVARGDLPAVLAATRRALDEGPRRTLFLFDDASGRMTDVDATSTEDEALTCLGRTAPADPSAPRRAGRPRLGVVSREVSLLPRHWEWLSAQSAGASAALRRLVDAARRDDPDAGAARLAREAAWRFLATIAPDVPRAEEVSRALFAGRYEDARRDAGLDWPADVRAHFLGLVDVAEAAG